MRYPSSGRPNRRSGIGTRSTTGAPSACVIPYPVAPTAVSPATIATDRARNSLRSASVSVSAPSAGTAASAVVGAAGAARARRRSHQARASRGSSRTRRATKR